VVRGPDASDTLVDTRDGLLGALQLLSAGLLQQIGLLAYLLRLEIPHANRLLPSVDVVSLDYRVLVWPRRYPDFDLRVCFREGREVVLEVRTITRQVLASPTQ
jgi:hypothetical protein